MICAVQQERRALLRKISKDKIIGEIAAVAFSDFTKFVSLETLPERGQVMTVTDTALLNRQSAKAVASIKAGTKGIEVKQFTSTPTTFYLLHP